MEIVLGIALVIVILVIMARIIGRLRRPVRNGEIRPDWQSLSAQSLSADESFPALNQGNTRRTSTSYGQATNPDLAKVQAASSDSLSASLAFSQPDLSTEAQDQLQLLLSQGRKIEAIKYYRQTTGVGLKEAKAVVDQMNADLPLSTPSSLSTTAGNNPPDPEVIYSLLHQGRKIEAIKYYRQITGVGLKEAKDAVDQMGAGFALSTPPPLNPAAENNLPDPDQIQSLLRQGRKIEAIKYYRQITGVGLKEAKDAVDQMGAGSAPSEPSSLKSAAGNSLIDPDQLQSLLRQGRKIEAIKYYRQTTGVGLKEAKDAVDWLQNNMSQGS